MCWLIVWLLIDLTFVGLLNFSRNRIVRVCLTSFGHMMSTISFFLLIDRYIGFVERRLTSQKAERFIVTLQFSPSALNCSLSSDFYFLFFSFICDAPNRKVNMSWRSRSTARASVLTIHHTTARPSLWVSQTCDLLFLNGQQTKYETFIFLFLSRRVCGRMCAISIDDPSLISWDFSR